MVNELTAVGVPLLYLVISVLASISTRVQIPSLSESLYLRGLIGPAILVTYIAK